jgi:hypothetical protein
MGGDTKDVLGCDGNLPFQVGGAVPLREKQLIIASNGDYDAGDFAPFLLVGYPLIGIGDGIAQQIPIHPTAHESSIEAGKGYCGYCLRVVPASASQ